MNAEACWELFLQTGAPEFYLLYREEAAEEAAPQAV